MPVLSSVEGSNRIPVTEASVEIGVDGRLHVHYREVPGGRDRSAPPSRGEAVAALARYRNRRMTDEQHRAVLEVLAACGALAGASFGEPGMSGAGGERAASQSHTCETRKATVPAAARRHFRGEGHTLPR